jgi:hypothetical protein
MEKILIKVRIHKTTGQLVATIPRDKGIKSGDWLEVKKVE